MGLVKDDMAADGEVEGAEGFKVANALRDWSGVIVLEALLDAGRIVVVLCGGGVDHENVAAGLVVPECVLESDSPECVAGEGCAQASNELSSALLALCLFRPRTRLSKSSASPLVLSRPLTRFGDERLDMKSALLAAVEVVVESSCNFRVCSDSMREESDLISVMKA
jgi:hypothetical protein